MPRRLPLYVERNFVKGKTYLSFRRGKGPRIRLPNDPTSPEFMAAYQEALTGQPVPVARSSLRRPAAGTIAALIASYKQSAAYLGLRSTTRKAYDTRLLVICDKHGHRTVAGMTREGINKGILQPFADRPGAALDTLKKLRVLIRHAIDVGMLKVDPSQGIKRPKINRIRSWTDDEIETFRKRWPLGTKQRLAFELFVSTGQRRSDVYRMAWSHITPENKIRVEQQKTGRRLVIPLHGDVIAALEAAPRAHVSILTTSYGRPFTVAGFSKWMRDAIGAAGLPMECQPHGLRKAAGRTLAEAGVSAKGIMSILGHTTLAEAERYTEDADQEVLADAAVIQLQARKANRVPQTASLSLGKQSKRKGKST